MRINEYTDFGHTVKKEDVCRNCRFYYSCGERKQKAPACMKIFMIYNKNWRIICKGLNFYRKK